MHMLYTAFIHSLNLTYYLYATHILIYLSIASVHNRSCFFIVCPWNEHLAESLMQGIVCLLLTFVGQGLHDKMAGIAEAWMMAPLSLCYNVLNGKV